MPRKAGAVNGKMDRRSVGKKRISANGIFWILWLTLMMLLFLWYRWPTPWAYVGTPEVPRRIHRITGRVEVGLNSPAGRTFWVRPSEVDEARKNLEEWDWEADTREETAEYESEQER
jgi:hypothetical protein